MKCSNKKRHLKKKKKTSTKKNIDAYHLQLQTNEFSEMNMPSNEKEKKLPSRTRTKEFECIRSSTNDLHITRNKKNTHTRYKHPVALRFALHRCSQSFEISIKYYLFIFSFLFIFFEYVVSLHRIILSLFRSST